MRLGGHCGHEMPELLVTRWDEGLGVQNRPQHLQDVVLYAVNVVKRLRACRSCLTGNALHV